MKRKGWIAALVCGVSSFASSAYAGWLSVIGVGCTIVAIGAAVLGGPPGAVAGGVLAIVEIGCVATDVVTTVIDRPILPFASVEAPDPILVADANVGAQLLGAQFQHVTVSDPSLNALATKTNEYIDSLNAYLSHAANGSDALTLATDLAFMGNCIDSIADEMDSLGYGTMSFNQSQIDSARASILTNGLPQWEIDFLTSAGLDQDYVDMFTDMHLVVNVTDLGGVTVSGMLRQAADTCANAAIDMAISYPLTPAPVPAPVEPIGVE
jgi:hypothetical protein